MVSDDPILLARLDAANDAQKRARLSLFASTLVAGTILAGLWNLYFSWDSYWASATKPATWGEEQVALQEIRSWVESNTVGVSLLGIRLSTSDAAITGTMFLLVLALYHCLCARRENFEIGAILVDSQQESPATKKWVFLRLRSLMLMISPDNDDSPYETLATPSRNHFEVPFLGFALRSLIFLPAVAIFAIVASDMYFLFAYVPPYAVDGTPMWRTISAAKLTYLAIFDSVALGAGRVVWEYCRQAARFKNGTLRIMADFEPLALMPTEVSGSSVTPKGSPS